MKRLTARRILSAERRGSSLPVVVETEDGRYFTKLCGAAQGPAALVAEIIVAELAERLDLRVPSRALVVIDGRVPSDDRDAELRDLLDASRGINLGFALLEGGRDLRADDVAGFDRDLASRILWLDALVQNPDRTERNPNIVIWRRQPWLVDHGAALGFHHDWAAVTEDSPRRAFSPEHHLLRSRASHLAAWDPILAARLDRAALASIVEAVAEELLLPLLPSPGDAESLRRRRAAYVAYLWKRLEPPRPFVVVA